MDLNEVKDKVLSTLGQAAGGAKDVAGKAVDKAKAGGRIARLSMEAATAREEVKKTYLEIGKLYYDTHKDDPEGFFIQLFEEVRVAEDCIASKEEELAALREILRESMAGVRDDFERVVDEAEAKAGTVKEAVGEKFDAVKDAAAEKFETVKDAAEEKFGEVKEAVQEKLDNAKDTAEDAAEAAEDTAEDAADALEKEVEKVEQEAAELFSEPEEKTEE